MRKATLLITMILGLSTFINAQQIKMGYTNVEYILAFMPEAQEVQAELTEYEGQLTAQVQSKYREFEQKLTAYQQGAEMMVEAVRIDKERELQQLQTSIQQFQSSAPDLVQQKQIQLLQPLYNRIQTAIDEVAKEEGYIVIFRSESLLYADTSSLEEVSELVFQKLGITPPASESE